jgi:F-type H+-transporting ATPase subunit a
MFSSVEKELLWYPLKSFGFTHTFFTLHASTLINTWIALGVLFLCVFVARSFLKNQKAESLLGPEAPIAPELYVVYLVKSIIKSFISLVEQSTGSFRYRYFTFTSSLFLFILFCNWAALIPYVEEPTKDLNTTLALGIITLLYIQKEIIQVHGFLHFLREYLLPVETFFPLNLVIGLAILPLKLLGEFASVISLSFRLFGNIFGGAIITQIFHKGISNSILFQTAAIPFGLVLTGFFILFEGGLQAFVFAILTLTNISLATAQEQGH